MENYRVQDHGMKKRFLNDYGEIFFSIPTKEISTKTTRYRGYKRIRLFHPRAVVQIVCTNDWRGCGDVEEDIEKSEYLL